MQYHDQIEWLRGDIAFTPKTYDRTHRIRFGGGITVDASSAPEFMGKAELVNPEELFIASISSCLMLTFLYLASLKNIVIDEYRAEAIGTLAKNAEGKMAMTEVVIKPSLKFGDNQTPDGNVLRELFDKAHQTCFISCSVKTVVRIEI
jgi:organic hydroperoxide reductase OsmC/OhrA